MGKNVTTREAEVLSLVSLGYKNKYIAKSLLISTRTVENHICHLCEKLVDSGLNKNKRVLLALCGFEALHKRQKY